VQLVFLFINSVTDANSGAGHFACGLAHGGIERQYEAAVTHGHDRHAGNIMTIDGTLHPERHAASRLKPLGMLCAYFEVTPSRLLSPKDEFTYRRRQNNHPQKERSKGKYSHRNLQVIRGQPRYPLETLHLSPLLDLTVAASL